MPLKQRQTWQQGSLKRKLCSSAPEFTGAFTNPRPNIEWCPHRSWKITLLAKFEGFDIVRECNLQAHEEHTQKTRSLLERPFGAMVLWMIGLGLGDEGDISVKGLKAVQQSLGIRSE